MGVAATGALSRPYIANAQAKTAICWLDQEFIQLEDAAIKQGAENYIKANGTVPVVEGFSPAWGRVNGVQIWGQCNADVIKNGMKITDAVDKAFKRA